METNGQDGVTARNQFRRVKSELYAYKVGHRDQDGNEVRLDQAQSQNGAPYVLGSPAPIQSVLDTLTALLGLQNALAPASVDIDAVNRKRPQVVGRD